MNKVRRKLVIVSNRLPVSVFKNEGKLEFKPSTGGLATAMFDLTRRRDTVWVGWPGITSDELSDKDKRHIIRELRKYKCFPVFLSREQINLFYAGYCNSTLWPLFHYHLQKVVQDSDNWEAYQQVNQQFGAVVADFAKGNVDVWIHDYQLLLLPAIVRQKRPDAYIGFFLHTPFPSYEVYRLLSERSVLLQGMLGADLIGFHTYDYVSHFTSSVLRILGHENSLGTIRLDSRLIRTDVFPIGIDYQKYASTAKRQIKTLLKKAIVKLGVKIILSVDRTDYSKGILHRLDAYEMFLHDNPEYTGHVIMIMLSVPSREEVEAYQDLRQEIEQKISHINGKYSRLGWSPITYQHQSLPFEEVVKLYVMADVMLVTSYRDGMNLVSKEYIASKQNGRGVLILSERTGAASELQEALLVNPNDVKMVASAIEQALAMPAKQQKSRLERMQTRLSSYTNEKWANDFIEQLNISRERQNLLKFLKAEDREEIFKSYSQAKSRLILLDYDGTLREFTADAGKDVGYPSPDLTRLLKRLSSKSGNKVVIISGRTKSMLQDWFRKIPVGLIAEHGSWIRDDAGWQKNPPPPTDWLPAAYNVLTNFADRTPGAKLERKEFSLVWHYRQVSPDLAYVRKHELMQELRELLKEYDVGVFEGHKILEIKPLSIHKGVFAEQLVAGSKLDFILAIGDDYTDEDMFDRLPRSSYTIKVGIDATGARYRLDSVNSVLELLEKLSKH